MSEQTQEYIHQNPGDLITAEAWNGMQQKIKQDIAAQISAAKKDIKETGVDRAGNADKFDNKTPKNWTDDLDQRYAQKIHDHEGQAVYRRYIKQFSNDLTKAMLRHNMGRYPLVDIYQLLPVVSRLQGSRATDGAAPDLSDCKLLFYYGEEDADVYGLQIRVYRDRPEYLGISFERMLADLAVEYEDDDTIQDVLNDLWTALWKDPNDEIKYCTSPWVDDCCERHRTVADLKRADQWKDLYIAIKPRKLAMGAQALNRQAPAGGNPNTDVLSNRSVEVTQISYDALLIEVEPANADSVPPSELLDLMFLLRS
jgi:hypothetical protein